MDRQWKKYLNPIAYLGVAFFVIAWWSFAFQQSTSLFRPTFTAVALDLQVGDLFPYLSTIEREKFREALAGNATRMIEFIQNWDQDADILAHKGIANVERLSKENFLKAHILAKLLIDESQKRLAGINAELSGRPNAKKRYIAQSYASASFLLALCQPDELVGIHSAIRTFTQLYPKEVTDQISTELDHFNSEKLFKTAPELAFIAPYSHPATVAILRQHGIPIFCLNNIEHIGEISQNLLTVGHLSNHVLEANLLNIFFEASMKMIDNRFKLLNQLSSQNKQGLYLVGNQHFAIPTTRSLAGQLLQRISQHYPTFSCPYNSQSNEWSIDYDVEKIVLAKPDFILLSSWIDNHNEPTLDHRLNTYSKQIILLDEVIQGSPTQYIALAYYDLLQALAVVQLT